MKPAPWEKRIARAQELAQTHRAAAELLNFYLGIARLQTAAYDDLQASAKSLDKSLLAPHFAPLLSLVIRTAPSPLSDAAEELARSGTTFQHLIDTYWDTETIDETHAFFARVLLQPYTELLASRSDISLDGAPSTCPFCGEKPVAGVLRGEGEGAKRSLICSLCSIEWEFRRILCPGCGEEAVDKLPVYTAGQFEHVRVEACDTCRAYIKSVDLTRNGLAVPIVDELATVPLNIWAEEHGYTKLQPNLLGM
jgi:FdhE protein